MTLGKLLDRLDELETVRVNMTRTNELLAKRDYAGLMSMGYAFPSRLVPFTTAQFDGNALQIQQTRDRITTVPTDLEGIA